jgi:hypothetical protein
MTGPRVRKLILRDVHLAIVGSHVSGILELVEERFPTPVVPCEELILFFLRQSGHEHHQEGRKDKVGICEVIAEDLFLVAAELGKPSKALLQPLEVLACRNGTFGQRRASISLSDDTLKGLTIAQGHLVV